MSRPTLTQSDWGCPISPCIQGWHWKKCTYVGSGGYWIENFFPPCPATTLYFNWNFIFSPFIFYIFLLIWFCPNYVGFSSSRHQLYFIVGGGGDHEKFFFSPPFPELPRFLYLAWMEIEKPTLLPIRDINEIWKCTILLPS